MAAEKNNKTLNVPNLRFPEFSGEWEKTRFERVVSLQRGSSPRPIIEYITKSSEGVNWVKIGDMPKYGRVVTSTEEKITKEGAKKSRHVNVGDLILSNSMSYGQPYIMNIEGYIHDGWFVLKSFENSFDRDYLCNLLISPAVQNQYRRLAAGGVVQNISSDLVNSVMVSLPSIKEQHKIASFLNLIDDRIATQRKVIEDLKKLKDAIRVKLFREVEKHCEVYDEIRNMLDYEQPSEYLVSSTEYSDNYKTPVLTANKAFILGYTDEVHGIYDKGDCIILDDFTMDVKYVTFPFKVKSSAIKILTPKQDVDLYFIYEYLLYLGLVSEEHKRHYISEIEPMTIICPPLPKQRQVARVLRALEIQVKSAKTYQDLLSKQKQYLLNQMFI